MNHNIFNFTVPLSAHNERLDKFLSQQLQANKHEEISRSRIQSWIEAGFVNDVSTSESALILTPLLSIKQKVKQHQIIQVELQPLAENESFVAENIPLEIVAEHEDYLVLYKPQGLVIHPAAGHWNGTLLNGLLYHFPYLKNLPRAGIIHRLDKDTSGLLVVAKNLSAQNQLSSLLQDKIYFQREYLAVVVPTAKARLIYQCGHQFSISNYLGRDRNNPIKKTIVEESALDARHAITHVAMITDDVETDLLAVEDSTHDIEAFEALLDNLPEKTWLVKCQLETGRTHQIRVHLTSVGLPIYDDPLYGAGNRLSENPTGQWLHAYRLQLPLNIYKPEEGLQTFEKFPWFLE